MRKKLFPALLIAVTPFFCGCSSDTEELLEIQEPVKSTVVNQPSIPIVFPTEDNAVALPNSAAEALALLMEKVDVNRAKQLGDLRITDEQFQEIKAFVDENLVGATGEATYKNIFKWLCDNLEYAWNPTPAYLDPYDVFIHKTCVCQGYANLLKAMMLTQDLPACCVNGYLVGVGAHAWNYVYDGEKWWVSDPTNGNQFEMKNVNSYINRLDPSSYVDFNLFEDESFYYGFRNGRLNINEIKKDVSATVCLPRSIEGYLVTSFDPLKELPTQVKVLGIPKNIVVLSQYMSTLRDYTPFVEEVYVEDGNENLESYKGIIYESGKKDPMYIPTGIKVVELKKKRVYGKNAIYDLPEVLEIYIPEGVTKLEAFAIEKCPKLKYVYVPEATKLDPQFLYNCPKDVEVVRLPTSIDRITM